MFSCEGSWLAVSVTWRLKSERMRCTVKEPMPTAKAHRMTNVSSAETPARRTRMGRRSKLAEARSESAGYGAWEPKREGRSRLP